VAQAAQHGVHADPAKLHAGQAGWIRTVKLAFFVALEFFSFRERVSSRQPPVSPDGDDVASRWAAV
jgi:hypothetical protein